MISNKFLSLFCFILLHQTIFILAQLEAPSEEFEFEEGIIFCTPPPEGVEISCTADYTPVCAYRNTNEEGDTGETVSNACVACNQFGFAYYTKGVCGGAEEELTALEEEFTVQGEFIGFEEEVVNFQKW